MTYCLIRFYRLLSLCMISGLLLTQTSALFSQANQNAADESESKQPFQLQQKVQVKCSSAWRDAIIINYRNDWYLVSYLDVRSKEWVEPWRVREMDSTDDNIGVATPNTRKPEEGPPPQKPGPAPKPPENAVKPIIREKAKSLLGDEFVPTDMERKVVAGYKSMQAVAVTKQKEDPDSVKRRKLRDSREGNQITTAPIPAADGSDAEKSTFSKMPLPPVLTANRPDQLIISGNGKRAFFRQAVRNGQYITVSLSVLDLEKASAPATVPLTNRGRILAVNPSGTKVVVLLPFGQFDKRPFIEIWNVIEFNGTPRLQRDCITRPYEGYDTHFPQGIEFAAFIDDNRLITWSGSRTIALWDLDAMTALYAVENADLGTPSALSPGRKYVAVANSWFISLLDVNTGETTAKYHFFDVGSSSRLTFSSDGRYLASVANGRIVTLDLVEGKIISSIRIKDKDPQQMALISENHLLVDDLKLVDFETRLSLWKYTRRGINSAPWAVMPDGRVITIAPAAAAGSHMVLAAAKLPDGKPAAWLESADLRNYFAFAPGRTIALGSIEAGNQTQQIRENLKTNLESCGLIVTDNNPDLKLTVSTTTGPTEEMNYGRGMFGMVHGGERISVTPYITTMKIEYKGQAVITAESSSKPTSFQLKEGETIAQAVARLNVPGYGFIMGYKFPKVVVAPDAPDFAGASPFPVPE